MYDVNALIQAIFSATPLLSWRQNQDGDGVQIVDADMVAPPVSGLYFNDFHPLLTPDNLYSLRPDYMLEMTGATLNTAFTSWLKETTRAAIAKAIDAWLSKKFRDRTVRSLIDRSTVYARPIGVEDSNEGKTVGLEITPRGKSVLVQVHRIAIVMNEAGVYKVNLESEGATIDTQNIIYSAPGGVQWVNVSWQIKGAPHRITYDQSQNPTAKSYSSTLQKTLKAVDIYGVKEGEQQDGTNYGINLDLSARCDYTDFIIEQIDLFRTVIGLRVAIDILREMAYNANVRVNRNTSNMADMRRTILYELDGDTQGRPGGLINQFQEALEMLFFDESGIDSFCLTCRRRGVRYTSV